MVMEAARMTRQGASIEQVLSIPEMMRNRMQVVFAVKTLENLAKGGRIGRASYLMSSMFEIKPLLKITDGVINAHSRHRTWQRALSELCSLVIEDVVASLTPDRTQSLYVGIAHTHNEVEGRQLADALNESLQSHTSLFGEVRLGLGIHSGPDALAVAWALMPES